VVFSRPSLARRKSGDLSFAQIIHFVTAIEERALRSEGNGPLPWSGLQTEFVGSERLKECKRRLKHQRPLKFFVSVPSLLRNHFSIDKISQFFL
jgi:hypothetical protein